eukprot:865538-Pyramimonas_sp.AAC.1
MERAVMATAARWVEGGGGRGSPRHRVMGSERVPTAICRIPGFPTRRLSTRLARLVAMCFPPAHPETMPFSSEVSAVSRNPEGESSSRPQAAVSLGPSAAPLVDRGLE